MRLEHAMHADAAEPRGTIVPTLRYRDVPAAIDWLCKAFGLELQLTVDGEDGAVSYAELTFGSGMVMLGPVEGAPGGAMTQPDAGAAETQICYLFVPDVHAHYARAKAAGAEIILDVDDEASGGRGYSCRDPEGHVWSFGTYDPEKRSAPRGEWRRSGDRRRSVPRRLAFAASLMAAMVGSGVLAGWALGIGEPLFHLEDIAAWTPPQTESGRLERNIREARESLARERSARELAERAAQETKAQLAQERGAREQAERVAREQVAYADRGRALDEAREQLAREKSALEAVRRAADEARERLALAERSAEAVREQLAAERSARKAAEHASLEIKDRLEQERRAREVEEREVKEAEDRAAKEERARQARMAAARRPQQRYRVVPAWSYSSRPPFVNWDVGAR
jgi:uncharacterized glyoxalase superfamily protein PhnB